MDIKLSSACQRNERKFNALLRVKRSLPELRAILMKSSLTQEEESILRFGLNHNLATKPNETQIIATAESIWDQLRRQNSLPDGFIKQQKIKNAIKVLACNILDFDDRQLALDN